MKLSNSGIAYKVMIISLIIIFWAILPFLLLPEWRSEFNSDSYVGCYTTNALVPYIECTGFFGSGLLQNILFFPVGVFLLLMLGFYKLF